MTVTDLLRTAARRELALARASIELFDRQLGRLGDGADVPRQVLRRVRDVLDPSAGASSNGQDDRAAAPGNAHGRSPRDPATEHLRDAASPITAPEEGSAVLTPEKQDEARTLAEEYLDEEDQHLTGELADDEELRRVQAELRAKHAMQEQDEQSARDT